MSGAHVRGLEPFAPDSEQSGNRPIGTSRRFLPSFGRNGGTRQTEILIELGLSFRIVRLWRGDLGFTSALTVRF